MPKPITISINVTKILKDYIYEGKSGKYLNLVLFENKDGPDQYGCTHVVKQDLGKEAREKGIKGPILGNAKFPTEEPYRPLDPPRRPTPSAPKKDADLDPAEEDSIPF